MIYLTDSIGDLIIDGQTYSITAGEAHVFSEGLEHYTINTGSSERLMIGPMSESGFGVGRPPASILYYGNETDAINDENAIGDYYIDNYTLQTINDISTWMILNNVDGTDPTPNGGPHYTDEGLIPTGTYYVYYNGPPPPPPPAPSAPRRIYMGSLFTNNAQVFYKPGSLSTGGGGSGVKNSRHKQRRT